MVARLKEFYRKGNDSEQFAQLNLNELAVQAVFLTQARWKDQAMAKGITITMETDLQEIPPVEGYASEIREALINLILNSADAMPDSGTITIRSRLEGENICLSVSDTGSGMTEEVRQSCLDPFFTTKDSQGTGMGLAMVYGTVQRHLGTLGIESEVGKGTSFTVRLPVLKNPSCHISEEQVDQVITERLHVLVVDDEPLIRQLLSVFLTEDGHTVETATDGCDGLGKFRAGHFDLVLTDRAMPEMDGVQLADAIKQASPGQPIIMLTGFGDIMAVTDDKPESVDLVLGKPVGIPELRQALVKVMASTSTPELALVGAA